MVTWPPTSAAPSRMPGSTSATVVPSDSRPSSTSCMIIVLVQILVMDPTWNTESPVTGTRVAQFSTPWASSTSCPSQQIPSMAPGTRALAASSCRRAVQFAVFSMLMDVNSLLTSLALTSGLDQPNRN